MWSRNEPAMGRVVLRPLEALAQVEACRRRDHESPVRRVRKSCAIWTSASGYSVSTVSSSASREPHLAPASRPSRTDRRPREPSRRRRRAVSSQVRHAPPALDDQSGVCLASGDDDVHCGLGQERLDQPRVPRLDDLARRPRGPGAVGAPEVDVSTSRCPRRRRRQSKEGRNAGHEWYAVLMP